MSADGLIGYRLVHQICARTGLVRDGDSLAVLDAALAEMVVAAGAMSKDQAERNIDTLVLMLDPLAVVRSQAKARGHRVDVHVDDATGTAHLDADLAVTDAQAFDKRVEALARTVCDRDPRDLDARRAAAVGAMGFGWDRLPCLCGAPDDCDAATKPAVGGIVIYMIARQDTIDAGTDAGPDGGPAEDPDGPGDGGADPGPEDPVGPDRDPDDGPDDVPDGGPSNEPQDPDGGPGEGPDGGPRPGSGGGASDDPKNLDDASEGVNDDPGDECSERNPAPGEAEVAGEPEADAESGDVESDDAATGSDTDSQTETTPEPPQAPPPDPASSSVEPSSPPPSSPWPPSTPPSAP